MIKFEGSQWTPAELAAIERCGGKPVVLMRRPFHQRLLRSYRGWRAIGFTRAMALLHAWRMART